MSKKTHLVIGGSGYLGSHLVQSLLELGDQVVSVDQTPNELPANASLVTHSFDINQTEHARSVLSETPFYSAYWCINLARQPGSSAAQNEQTFYNIKRLINCLGLIRGLKIDHLLIVVDHTQLSIVHHVYDLLAYYSDTFGIRLTLVLRGDLVAGHQFISNHRPTDEQDIRVQQLFDIAAGNRLFLTINDADDLEKEYQAFDVIDFATQLIEITRRRIEDDPWGPGLVAIEPTNGAVLPLSTWIERIESQLNTTIPVRMAGPQQDPVQAVAPAAPAQTLACPVIPWPTAIHNPDQIIARTRRSLRKLNERRFTSIIQELENRFPSGKNTSFNKQRLEAWWKRRAWTLFIATANASKRAIDIAGALTLLTLLSPMMLMVMAIVRLQDGGPAIFWQMRVGLYGREFPFPKFRSMTTNAEALKLALAQQNMHNNAGAGSSAVTFKMKRDPRITPFGRIIRKLSVDELPQLWCVLTGEMSLVGPRPPVPSEVAKYSLRDRQRLNIKPGLTCIWQVTGRSDISFDQQVELDVQYLNSQSLWLDIKLLFKTIPAVILGKGAY